MTTISRIFGFVRDMVIARIFGAGVGADAFFVAFKIPNFLRRLFAEGAFSQAFVPVLSEYRSQRPQHDAKTLIDNVSGTFGVVLLAVTALGVLAAPLITLLSAPGYLAAPQKYTLTVSLLRITLPYLLFISLTALSGAILNTYGRFAVPAFTPVLLNFSMIGAAIWLAPHFDEPVIALAWGVFLGGAAQLAFQLPFLLRLRLLPRPRIGAGHDGVRRITRLMLPALFAVSISQINLFIDVVIASFLVTGSVSWLYYSDRLVEFPLGVFGIALATVILPNLSEKHARGATHRFSETVDWALRWVFLVGVPASLGLSLLAAEILCTLFQYGEFSGGDVLMSSRSLMAYALGLVGFTLIKVLAPGYFSRQDTRTPVKIGVIAMLANLLLNLILVIPLAHAGLALATSCSGFLNAWLLFQGLRNARVYQPGPGWRSFLFKVAVANVIMACVLWLGGSPLVQWLAWDAADRAGHLLALILGGALIYAAMLTLLGIRWRDLVKGSGGAVVVSDS